MDLFEELQSLAITYQVTKERMDEIKRELDQFQYMVDAAGIQHNGYVYTREDLEGRRKLSPTLLMEYAGISKQLIDACYVKGEPYSRRCFRKLGEKSEEG